MVGTVLEVERECIWIEAEGSRALLYASELMLDIGEVPSDRYSPGDRFEAFVFQMRADPASGAPQFSIRRAAPYSDARNSLETGSVVAEATVVNTYDVGIELDIDGVRGNAHMQELPLVPGQSPRDRYQPGDTVYNLFVPEINHYTRFLELSVRRNAPDYVEALDVHSVGDVVSATITSFQGNDGLWLDVGGVVGGVSPWELPLADGESARDHYTIGDTVDDLFVWQVNHDKRDLFLSVRRHAPGYVEALTQVSAGDPLDAIVAHANEGGLWLDVADVIGWIPAPELLLNDGESPDDRYSPGDPVKARVWQIDQPSRTVLLSVRRLDSDFPEEALEPGATINAVVREGTQRGVRSRIRVLVASNSMKILPHALSLSTSIPPPFKQDDEIPVFVVAVDEQERPIELSHRRALEGWSAAAERLTPGDVVPDAYVLPYASLPFNEHRAAVDLGPITGFVPEDELDQDTAAERMMYNANETFPVVVESVDRESGTAIVSREKFAERWEELVLAADLREGAEVDAELREVAEGVAVLDLDSGLLTNLPVEQLPDVDASSKAPADRIGERIPLRISKIERDKQIINVEPREYWLERLIGEPESEKFELKEVLRGSGDLATRKKMTLQVVRTINAFVNSKGGQLVIGVHDVTREPLGLEGDSGLSGETIAKKLDNATRVLEDNIRFKPRSPLENVDDDLVTWRSASIGGKTLLLVECKRGPAHGVNFVRSEKEIEFWVRNGSNKDQLHTDDEINEHLVKRAQQISQENAASSNADAG